MTEEQQSLPLPAADVCLSKSRPFLSPSVQIGEYLYRLDSEGKLSPAPLRLPGWVSAISQLLMKCRICGNGYPQEQDSSLKDLRASWRESIP